MRDSDLESFFPALAKTSYDITSPSTTDYNCVAWAACNSDRWWWPDPFRQYFWPADIPRELSVEAFTQAFAAQGFKQCESLTAETGYEKVVIYIDRAGQPTHMARQLDDGTWTSKLGTMQDIAHADARDLEGQAYGRVSRILRRPK